MCKRSMLMTINQVAQKLGVDYQTAVGLLAYLRLKNAVDVTLSPGEPGKRGRKASFYRFNQATTAALATVAVALTE